MTASRSPANLHSAVGCPGAGCDGSCAATPPRGDRSNPIDLEALLTGTPPPGDRRTIVIVHHDAQDAVVYWCGYTNGHDGQGWTADRREAMEFSSMSAANLERKVCRRMHPTMATETQGSWDGGDRSDDVKNGDGQ